jgi:hypothetical protein
MPGNWHPEFIRGEWLVVGDGQPESPKGPYKNWQAAHEASRKLNGTSRTWVFWVELTVLALIVAVVVALLRWWL